MKMPIKRKARLLTELLAQYEGTWRVIGITKAALEQFIECDFKNAGFTWSYRKKEQAFLRRIASINET